MIALEEVNATGAKFKEVPTGEKPRPMILSSPGALVLVRNLVRGQYTAGGVQDTRQTTLKMNKPAFYHTPKLERSNVDGAGGDKVDVYSYSLSAKDVINANDIHEEFTHTDLNFSFEWMYVPIDPRDAAGWSDAPAVLDISFLLYPNPFYTQRF